MTPAAVTIVLDDKRRQLGLWWQKLQHAVGGVPLLMAFEHWNAMRALANAS